MAHTTAMNSLVEQLVNSLVPRDVPATQVIRLRRAKENFVKTLKYHNYARTNQFDVEQKLTGMEEKFQIQNRDDLSDALFASRVELKSHDLRWLPDALDLLIHLSQDPVGRASDGRLYGVQPKSVSQPDLKWSDVVADDPIDQDDPIWQVPDYSDLSSEEDEYEVAPQAQSLHSAPCVKHSSSSRVKAADYFLEKLDISKVSDISQAQYWRQKAQDPCITELQAIRESLFMLQGLPTTLYDQTSSSLKPSHRLSVKHIASEAFEKLLNDFCIVGDSIACVRKWLAKAPKMHYMQKMHDNTHEVLMHFEQQLTRIQADTIRLDATVVFSLSAVYERVRVQARDTVQLGGYLDRLQANSESLTHPLDALLDLISSLQSLGTVQSTQALGRLFIDAFEVYLRPIRHWMAKAELIPHLDEFFIVSTTRERDLSRIWLDWYTLHDQADTQAPKFLQPFLKGIFACGKTTLYLRALGVPYDEATDSSSLDDPVDSIRSSTNLAYCPFDEAVTSAVNTFISTTLHHRSRQLRRHLEEKHGLWDTVEVLGLVYLARHGHLTETTDARIFDKIDRGDSHWNDRYLIANLFRDAFASTSVVNLDSIIVYSKTTSTRAITSQRQSVRILENLSVQYILPWPIANIIPQAVLGSYRRVALFLTQIRRARHTLLRRAHFFVHNGLLHIDADGRKLAQVLHFDLLLFTNMLYDHLTTCVIDPSTASMKTRLSDAVDVDAMILTISEYAAGLEEACLTAKKLKLIRDTVILVLDLCIRFSDIVSTPKRRSSDDVEVDSFISAHSRQGEYQRRRKEEDVSSDDEDGSNGEEGYSTFVVFEDSSPVKEVQKLLLQFERHRNFLLAGLRGIARSGEQGLSWEMLADRLDWKSRPV